MAAEDQQEKQIVTFEADPIRTWKAYIRTLQRLKTTDANEYQKIPKILKQYSHDDIEKLTLYDIEALQSMKALPTPISMQVTEEQIEKTQAYLRTLQKLKVSKAEYAKVPAVLRNLSDDEIEYLDANYWVALKLMDVFPETVAPKDSNEKPQMQKLDQALLDFCKTDPELQRLAENPTLQHQLALHPKILAFLERNPDLKEILEQEKTRQQQAMMNNLGLPIFYQPASSTPPQPYTSHPYGSSQTTP